MSMSKGGVGGTVRALRLEGQPGSLDSGVVHVRACIFVSHAKCVMCQNVSASLISCIRISIYSFVGAPGVTLIHA